MREQFLLASMSNNDELDDAQTNIVSNKAIVRTKRWTTNTQLHALQFTCNN